MHLYQSLILRQKVYLKKKDSELKSAVKKIRAIQHEYLLVTFLTLRLWYSLTATKEPNFRSCAAQLDLQMSAGYISIMTQ